MNPKTKVYKIPCSICGTIVEKRVVCSPKCQTAVLKNAKKDRDGQKNETLVDMTDNWWERETASPPPATISVATQPTPTPVNLCEHGNPIGRCEFGCL